MLKITVTEFGLCYLAFQAYNHNRKKDRISRFDPASWLKVVRAIKQQKEPRNAPRLPSRSARRTVKPRSLSTRSAKRNGALHQA